MEDDVIDAIVLTKLLFVRSSPILVNYENIRLEGLEFRHEIQNAWPLRDECIIDTFD